MFDLTKIQQESENGGQKNIFKKKFYTFLMTVLLFISLFSASTIFVPPVYSAEIFSDSFDSGDLSAWNGNYTAGSGAISLNNTIKYSSDYSLKSSSSAEASFAYAYKNISSADVIYMQFFVYIDSESGNEPPVYFATFESTTLGGSLIRVGITEAERALYIRIRSGGTTAYGKSATTVSLDEWHRIEISRVKSELSGEYYVWFDGELVTDIGGNAFNTNDYSVDLITVGHYNSYRGAVESFIDNVVVSDSYIGTGTDLTPPTYRNLSHSTTLAGTTCQFNATFNDDTDLTVSGSYIFSTNNTGAWQNETATIFTSTPQTVSVTKTLNSTASQIVGYNWFFNDTAGNWNSTGIQSFALTEEPEIVAAGITIVPWHDAYVIQNNPDYNTGDLATIQVTSRTGRNERSFLGFSLDYYLPESANIVNATLRLKKGTHLALLEGVTDVQVHKVSNDTWDEATITWNNQPSIGDLIETQIPPIENVWMEWNVTDYIISEWAGNQYASFALKTATENYDDEWRIVVFKAEEAGYPHEYPELLVYFTESEPPTYSNISYSSNQTGAVSVLNCTWEDNFSLSGYIFSTNNTGVWTNSTWTAFTSNPQTLSQNLMLNATAGIDIGFRWYANDTLNNWNATTIQTLTTIPMTLTIYNPTNSTYTSGNIPIEFSTSGGIIDHKWYNVKNSSEWVYPENQTYTTSTILEDFDTGEYQFFAYANNTGTAQVSDTLYFSVDLPAVPVDVEIIFPQALTYPTSSVYIELNATGGTIDKIWFNIKVGSEWVYENNQNYTSPTTITLANNVYTFWAWANNTDGSEDVELVTFTVYEPPTVAPTPSSGGSPTPVTTYVVTIQVVREQSPVVGVSIVFGDSTKTSDNQGYSTFSISAGTHNLLVIESGNVAYSTQFTVERDGTWQIDLSKPNDPPADITLSSSFSVPNELVQIGIIAIIVVILLAFLISQSKQNKNLEKLWRQNGKNVKRGRKW